MPTYAAALVTLPVSPSAEMNAATLTALQPLVRS